MKTIEELRAENRVRVDKLLAVQFKVLDRLRELGLGLEFWDAERFGEFVGDMPEDKIHVNKQSDYSPHLLLFFAEDTVDGSIKVVKSGFIWEDILEDDFDVEEEIKRHLAKLNLKMTNDYVKLDEERRKLAENRDRVVAAVNSLGINIYEELYKRRDNPDA